MSTPFEIVRRDGEVIGIRKREKPWKVVAILFFFPVVVVPFLLFYRSTVQWRRVVTMGALWAAGLWWWL